MDMTRLGDLRRRSAVAALVATTALLVLLVQGASATWTSYVSKTAFDNFYFPGHLPIFSYENLQAASGGRFAAFANSESSDDLKREVAAFFAQISHESGGLKYQYEQNCNTACQQSYCDTSSKYKCSRTQPPYYFGRGPIQLSWNYNYGACGDYLGKDLLGNPGLISTDGVTAFQTALWFWMANGCHLKILLDQSFGGTTKIINGDIECKTGAHYSELGHQEMLQRVQLYKKFCDELKVGYGTQVEC